MIRVAELSDAEEVTAVLRASYGELLRDAYDPALLDAALPFMTNANPRLLASGSYYLSIAENGRLMGCGGWTCERPGSGAIETGLAHLRHFATHPNFVRRGVARELVKHTVAMAREAGIERFERFSTLAAEPFYSALGFSRVSAFSCPVHDEVTLPSVLMTRRVC